MIFSFICFVDIFLACICACTQLRLIVCMQVMLLPAGVVCAPCNVMLFLVSYTARHAS